MNIVEFTDVSKSYSSRPVGLKEAVFRKKTHFDSRFSRQQALSKISFHINPGDSYAIVGNNGTGKSTLLQLILGTIKPDFGSVKVSGKVAPLLELGAGFHPELSGRDNIFLYGSILGMSLGEISDTIDKIIDFSELESAVDQPIRTYSSGMIARLGFSVVINFSAEIILIDEVLAVGDTQFKTKCINFLKDFNNRGGTLVIVSHERDVVKAMCNRGLFLSGGRVLFEGGVDELLSEYGSIEV